MDRFDGYSVRAGVEAAVVPASLGFGLVGGYPAFGAGHGYGVTVFSFGAGDRPAASGRVRVREEAAQGVVGVIVFVAPGIGGFGDQSSFGVVELIGFSGRVGDGCQIAVGVKAQGGPVAVRADYGQGAFAAVPFHGGLRRRQNRLCWSGDRVGRSQRSGGFFR